MKRYVFGKSVQGASHRRTGKECQDSKKIIALPDSTVIVAVADGHGSASCPYSKNGSSIAVNVFCDVMKELCESYRHNKDQLLTYLNREGDTRLAREIDEQWKASVLQFHKDADRDWPKTEEKEKTIEEVYTLYGTTLVGLMLTPSFVFGFQIGDGDITYVDKDGYAPFLVTEKIYGVETHSLCKVGAWKKAVADARRWKGEEHLPSLFMLSTDGFANSYATDEIFEATCRDYFSILAQHGARAVNAHLESWLNETSAGGCGDDITLVMIYTCTSPLQ